MRLTPARAGILLYEQGDLIGRALIPNSGQISTIDEAFYDRILNGDDLQQTLIYADIGTPDQRVTQIVTASEIGVVIDTIQYAGSPGRYRIVSQTRSRSA